MQFYSPHHLWLLWLIPGLIIFFVYVVRRKQKVVSLFAQAATMRRISLNTSYIKYKYRILFSVIICILIIIALAQPQWGNEKTIIRRKGVDIMFLLDTSKSMLVEDVKPNRFEKAQRQIFTLLKKLEGDRVALVVFAGSSFLDCPLTLDYSAFKIFLDSIKVGFIPEEGTSLARAIREGITSYQDNVRKYQVMVIFSDGEDHSGGMAEIIDRLKTLGIRVYVVGMGTPDGGPIPHEGGDTRYKQDPTGNIVISKLREKQLRDIAVATDGLYYRTTTSDKELELIYNHIRTLEKRQFKRKLIVEKEDQFQLFLLGAFMFLVIEFMLGERRRQLA